MLKFNTIMGAEKLVEINNMQMSSGFDMWKCNEHPLDNERFEKDMDARLKRNENIWSNTNSFDAADKIAADPSVTTLTVQFRSTVLTAFVNQSISDIVKNAQAAKDNKQIVYDITELSGMDAYEQKLGQVLGIKPV